MNKIVKNKIKKKTEWQSNKNMWILPMFINWVRYKHIKKILKMKKFNKFDYMKSLRKFYGNK